MNVNGIAPRKATFSSAGYGPRVRPRRDDGIHPSNGR